MQLKPPDLALRSDCTTKRKKSKVYAEGPIPLKEGFSSVGLEASGTSAKRANRLPQVAICPMSHEGCCCIMHLANSTPARTPLGYRAPHDADATDAVVFLTHRCVAYRCSAGLFAACAIS